MRRSKDPLRDSYSHDSKKYRINENGEMELKHFELKGLPNIAKYELLRELRRRNAEAKTQRDVPDKLWRSDFKFYGVNAKFRQCLDPTILLAGPAETGKTITTLALVHEIAITNPGVRGVIVRKTRASMDATVLRTWEDKILPEDKTCIYKGKTIKVHPYGGEKPQWYEYSNKSRIYVTGIDNGSKILSGEFDFVYVNQAEDLDETDIESLETRVTGRAGNIKTRPPQLIMDCNPGGSKHPLKLKERAGSLTMYNSRHEDNPTLYYQVDHPLVLSGEVVAGTRTPQGEMSLSRLDTLTGVRLQRLRYGIWAGAEGLYFAEFDTTVHGVKPIPKESLDVWDKWLSMDYGFNHWNVIYLHAADGDGNIYTIHELAHRKHYPHEIAPDIHAMLKRYGYTIDDMNGIYASPDAFANTGRAEKTIAQQYADHEIYMVPALAGAGSRVAKAHLLQDMLGSVERKIPPRWFYVAENCPKLEECIPSLIASDRNDEDVKKVDCNEAGDGGDDPYDALMMGLYRPGGASFA